MSIIERGLMPRIGTIYAAVSVDENGDEGVCAFMQANGVWMPLIAADPKRLEQITALARQLASDRQIAVRIVSFTSRHDLETIDGRQ